MAEHVILVAFTVDTDLGEHTHGVSRAAAMESLMGELRPILNTNDERSSVAEWWIAEDDRTDGSDNNSAVFVSLGLQYEALRLLHSNGLTSAHNLRR